jgi:hypothetical protein
MQHSLKHDDVTTITSKSPIADAAQMTTPTGYSIIVDDTEYRSASPMHILKTSYSGIYTDAYLFDVATRMLDAGMNTIDAAEKLVADCRIDRDAATRIVSLAFDPSNI